MKKNKISMKTKTKKTLWAEYFVDGNSIFVALEDVDSKDKKVYELKSLVVEDELGYALVKSDMEYDKKKFNIKRKAYNSYTAKNICRDRDTGELLPVHVIVLELPATFAHIVCKSMILIIYCAISCQQVYVYKILHTLIFFLFYILLLVFYLF